MSHPITYAAIVSLCLSSFCACASKAQQSTDVPSAQKKNILTPDVKAQLSKFSHRQIIDELNGRIQAGAVRPSDTRPVNIVGTQNLVAGLENVRKDQLTIYAEEREESIKSLYPPGNRVDLFELQKAKPALDADDQLYIRQNADATVCLVDAGVLVDLHSDPDPLKSQSRLGTMRLGDMKFRDWPDKHLCENEEFLDQPSGSYCSGTLVGDDLVLTAGHCAGSADHPVKSVRCIFGYRMKDAATPVTTFSNAEIYAGKEVVARAQMNNSDWALIRLDRKVVGHAPARIKRYDPNDPVVQNRKIADHEPVYMIGFPLGLPVKFAGGAEVKQNTNSSFFQANLDAFGGNSGSGVYNMKHELVGVLYSGAADFTLKSGSQCVSCAVYSGPDDGAEKCTRTTEFARLIPVATAPKALAASPALWAVSITFNTDDDDKDFDTKLSVELSGPNGRFASLGDVAGPIRFPDGSTNGPFNLAVEKPVTKDDVLHSQTTLTLRPVGHDTWKFGYKLTFTFADGSSLSSRPKLGCKLSEQELRRTWTNDFAPEVSGGTGKLIAAEVITTTDGENKDHDSGLFVTVVENDGTSVIASVQNADNSKEDRTEYKNNTTHGVPLGLNGNVNKEQCDRFKFKIGLKANGNDLWKVAEASVTLHFDDGRSIQKHVGYFELNSRGSSYVETPWYGGQ